MRIFIDDGSTNIKMLWEQDGETFTHISPNSFKRGWSATFGSGKPFNYTVDDEKYSFDLITPDALPTNNIDWQYSPLNSIAVHHALLTSGLEPQDVEIVVTLPLTEFYDEDAQYRLDNIERKKKSLLRDVKLNKGVVFNITKVTVRPGSRREKASFTSRTSLCERDSMIQAWRAEASSAPTSINSEPKTLFNAFICFGPLIHAEMRCARVA